MADKGRTTKMIIRDKIAGRMKTIQQEIPIMRTGEQLKAHVRLEELQWLFDEVSNIRDREIPGEDSL